MVEVSDEAWIQLIDTLEQIEAGDEITFGLVNDRGEQFGESELISMLDRAAELGMIEQINDRTWIRREAVRDWTPLEEYYEDQAEEQDN